MAKDPVCGMNVDEKTAVRTEHKGKTYHFRSPACQETFSKSPAKFTGEKAGTRRSC